MLNETEKYNIVEAYYNYAKIITYGDTYKLSSDSRTIIFHLEGMRITFTVGGKRLKTKNLMPYFLFKKPKRIVSCRALLMERMN